MPQAIQDFYYKNTASQSHSPSPQNFKTNSEDVLKSSDTTPYSYLKHDPSKYFKTTPHMFEIHNNDFQKYFKTTPQILYTRNKYYLQKEFDDSPQEFKTCDNDHSPTKFDIESQKFKIHNHNHHQNSKITLQQFKTHKNYHF